MKSTVWAAAVLLVAVWSAGCGDKNGAPGPTRESPAVPSGASVSTVVVIADAAVIAGRGLGSRVNRRPADAAPKPIDIVAYRKSLARGRRSARAGKYAVAITSFEASLRARPRDAVALSEISWAAFKAGQLDRAIAAASKSITRGFGDTKAASFYNLGRALEQKGDRKGAASAYARSLELRPHQVVAARLEKLTGTQVGNTRTAIPMFGPFKNFLGMCLDSGHHETACNAEKARVKAASTPPILGAHMFNAKGAGCVVAVQSSRGWYHLAVDTAQCIGNRYWTTTVHSVNVLTRGPRRAGIAEFRYTEIGRDYVSADRSEGMEVVSEEESATVCGMGAAGKPSCANVQIRVVDKASGQRRLFTYRLAQGPVIKLTGRGKTMEHRIVFP